MLRAILSVAMLFQGIPFPGPGRAPTVSPPSSISIAQTGFAQNAGTGATVSVTLSGVTAGSTIATAVAVCKNIGCTANGATYTIAVNDGTAYTNGLNCYASGTIPITVSYLPNASAGSHTITATISGTAAFYYAAIVAYEIAGASTTTPFDSAASVAACNNGTSGTASVSNGASITSADSALIAFVFPVTATASTSTGSGWTGVAGSAAAAGAYRVVSSATTYTESWTVAGGSSVFWATAIAAFKP